MSPEATEDMTSREAQAGTISVEDTNVYDGIKITDKKKDIVEYIAHHPEATNREISESDEVDCSISYPSTVRNEFSDLIQKRAKEVGSNVQDLEDSIERSQKKRAGTWSDLTTKQRDVLRRLAEEDDPENQTSSLRAIIEDLDFDTHPAYVSDVRSKYVDYAKKLKKAQNMADESQDSEALIDEIELEEEVEVEDTDETVEEATEDEMEPSEEPSDDVDVEPISASNDLSNALQSLREEIKSQKKMAQSEMKYSDSELAAGRLVMAEQIEDKINELTGAVSAE